MARARICWTAASSSKCAIQKGDCTLSRPDDSEPYVSRVRGRVSLGKGYAEEQTDGAKLVETKVLPDLGETDEVFSHKRKTINL